MNTVLRWIGAALLRPLPLFLALVACPVLAVMVICPECSRRVSNEAAQCPNCGLPGARLRDLPAAPSPSFPGPTPSIGSPVGRASDPAPWFDTQDSGLEGSPLQWTASSGTLQATEQGLTFKAAAGADAGLKLRLVPPGPRGILLLQVLAEGGASIPVRYSQDANAARGIYSSYSSTSISPGSSSSLSLFTRSREAWTVTFSPAGGAPLTLVRLRAFWFPSPEGSSSYPSYNTPSALTPPAKPQPVQQGSAPVATVLIVDTNRGSGSAFLARQGNETFIFTNQHVLGGAKAATFRTTDGRRFSPASMEVAAQEDLVRLALSAEDALTVKQALMLAEGEPRNGESIRVYGNSQGASTITELPGVVQSVGPQLLEVTAPFVEGNSGGPICNAGGQVLGVSSFVTRAAAVSWVTADSPFSRSRRFGYRVTPRTQWIKVSPQAFQSQARLVEDVRQFLGALAISLDHLRIVNFGGVGTSAPFLDARFVKAQGDALFHDARWTQYLENFSQRFAFAEGRADRRLNPSEVQRHVTNLRQEYGRLADLALADLAKTRWVSGFLGEQAKESTQLGNAIKTQVGNLLGGR